MTEHSIGITSDSFRHNVAETAKDLYAQGVSPDEVLASLQQPQDEGLLQAGLAAVAVAQTASNAVMIPLRGGKFALVSPQDADLAQCKWHYHNGGYTLFRRSSDGLAPEAYTIFKQPSNEPLSLGNQTKAHLIVAERILNRPLERGETVKLRDGNHFNVQRENIEIATSQRRKSMNAGNISMISVAKGTGMSVEEVEKILFSDNPEMEKYMKVVERTDEDNVAVDLPEWEGIITQGNMDRDKQIPLSVPMTVEWLPVDKIKIDRRYQRPVSVQTVRDIANNYTELASGTLAVNLRDDGDYYNMDGQQRLEAVKKLGKPLVLCKVAQGLTIEQEVKIYLTCQMHRQKPNNLDVFRARLIMKEIVPIAIVRIVEKCGLTINLHSARRNGKRLPKSIVAVAALETIYKRGTPDSEKLLEDMLTLARDSWPDEGKAFQKDVLLGITDFHFKYRGKYIRTQFISKMNVTSLDGLLRRAQYQAENGGGSMRLTSQWQS